MFLLFSSFSFGQAWSGVLAPSRAIDWSHAGLPTPTLPDNEDVPNPWTPPTRTLCTTLTPSGGDDAPQINAAVSGCAQGTYVLLNQTSSSVPFQINSGLRLGGSYTSGHNYVTVRGNGPMSTKIQMGSSGAIYIGAAEPNPRITLASNPAKGATSVTLSSAPSGLVSGQLAWLEQCDDGISGSGCGSGTHIDTGGLYFCGNGACSMYGSDTDITYLERQFVVVTSISGNTVNFSPGIYLSNWSAAKSAGLAWQGGSYQASGIGLEDFTLMETLNASVGVDFSSAYASWIKGVRIINMGSSSTNDITLAGISGSTKNVLVANNYIGNPPNSTINEIFGFGWDSDDLIANNIITGGTMVGTGSTQGDVIAYNYIRDTWPGQPYGNFQHQAGSAFTLMEGNQIPRMSDDDTFGTHNLNTFFRNNFNCYDPPWTGGQDYQALSFGAYARFENAIGNTLGSLNSAGNPVCPTYSSTNSPYLFAINLGGGNNNPSDALASLTLFRWGNYAICSGDSHCNNASNFDSKENPVSLSGVAATYSNLASPSTAMPASFFISGGAPSWFNVCTSWSAFPGSCAATQSTAFPAIGPDVSGGRADSAGHARDIPAAVAYKNLPIDPAYQKSFTATASSWSGGIETLTVSGFSGAQGGFQLTGANAACLPTSGLSFTGNSGEILMTAASATSVSYVLPANPTVQCTGTAKWPDIRQFDERVYASTSGGGGGSGSISPPTGLIAIVQ
jgi:hypothetical protein